ncbi:MAG: SphA family protein [Syntrophobacteraceae bacterium]
MKKFIMGVCVCLAILTLVSSAFAEELYDWHLRGINTGLANGALPPPGAYFINNFYFQGTWKLYGNNDEANPAVRLNGYVDVPVLLWNPGISPVLGADYACALVQPFSQSTLRIGDLSGSQWGAYNTILVPFILSWEIPCHLHVAASFGIGFNDGTTSPGNSLAATTKVYRPDMLMSPDGKNVYGWASNDNYTFTPSIGISWLYEGWNLSAEFDYTFWTKDTDCDYQNGDQFAADYTATYTCGKWTFGAVGEQENQLYNDKGHLVQNGPYGKIPNSCQVNYAAGPYIGYNFGPCSLSFSYFFAIMTKNDLGGDWALLRLVIPLGNPCSWYK